MEEKSGRLRRVGGKNHLIGARTQKSKRGRRSTVALEWVPGKLDPDLPLSLALVKSLEESIQNGSLAVGTPLPPHRTLANHLGWSLSTVSKAYREASIRGIVSGRVGQGTFVARPRNEEPVHPNLPVRLDINLAPDVGQRDVLLNGLSQTTSNADKRDFFAYDASHGLARHRDVLAQWISTPHFRPSPDNLLLVNGAQHGLDLALSIVCKPGSTVIVEELTYVGFKPAASLRELSLVTAAMDEEGLVPEDLDQKLEATGAKVVYAMPTLHSPTARTMSTDRRRAIAAVIARRDALLIEDDVYGFLPQNKQEPIAGLLPDRTVYLASLSKIFELGYRAGIVTVPPALLKTAQLAMRGGAWSATPLLFEVASHLIESGALQSTIDDLRREAHRRFEIFREVFPNNPAPTQREVSGYHVWLALDGRQSAEDVFYNARKHGILVTPPGSATLLGTPENGIRLCLGACRGEDLRRTLLALKQVVERPSQLLLSVV
ncbi:aminotransferase-like domain-containing protein [Bradyrhizobium sp. DOA9]|uniref:aminotransferase-like domain-containing protein n=1 Tax=Bradyrhizobium sp. DOA9 TaxID=1126627 RepID=UPI0004695041|nr:PLP-dependent aminotransferase family protein [Bradyrhizobium sp. DOA9]